jgi:RHS repeat-associated protein
MSLGLADVSSAQNANDEFTWTYLPGSDLKASLQYPNGLTASWQYDANNQLLQVRNATPTNIISQFDYIYDAAGRRTAIAKSGSAFGDLSGSIDAYTYNTRSELTSARRTKNGQPIPGFSEDFDYDPIGNRRSSSTYNEKGEAQTSTYQANNLNQYTFRTTPGYAAVRGEADPNATVTVNENLAFRLGSYYFGSDLFDNTTAGGLAALETYATLAQTAANGEEAEDLVSAETNQVYLAQSPETFAYDDDGNQTLITTKTGLWLVTYNGENRPIRWVRDSDNTTLTMAYDHMGRRREKNAQRFFYDGYLQVVNFHSPTQTQSSNYYIWDCTEPVATRPLVWTKNDLSSYCNLDGNKNVSEVVAADGAVSAHYEYAPFGAVIAHCGESAAANPWRFSCEYAEDETATVYYNYRHYEPVMGRWTSRDPIAEEGVGAIYSVCRNSVVLSFDFLGMSVLDWYRKWKCGDGARTKQIANYVDRGKWEVAATVKNEIIVAGPKFGGYPGVGDSSTLFFWYSQEYIDWGLVDNKNELLKAIGKGYDIPCRMSVRYAVDCECECNGKSLHEWSEYSDWTYIYGMLKWYALGGRPYCECGKEIGRFYNRQKPLYENACKLD